MVVQRVEVEVEGLQDGQMKEVNFPEKDSEGKILLSKIKGQYYATTNKCTHFGAPLVKGVITAEGRIVCPWHGACFNACTGDIEDAPGQDNLTSFKVETSGSKVFVHAPTTKEELNVTRKPPSLEAVVAPSSHTTSVGVLIVGGGPSSVNASEQLRESGYKGSIKVISKENYLPVDRTKLSKALISDANKVALRSKDFFQDLKVDFELGKEVTKVSQEDNTVTTSSGETITYEHLILAPGSNANRIPVDGSKLENIFVLRTIDDVSSILGALGDEPKDKNVVVIGSSFIGMEAALAINGKGAKVTVVGMEKVPFELILGSKVGAGIQKHHESKGTKFFLPASLDHFSPSQSSSSKVGSVHLKDGTTIPADLVILGVGVKPATAFLKESGFTLEKDGSIATDGTLKVKQAKGGNVFAVGDIATWPDHQTGKDTRVEHWNVASNHARAVARTIAGQPTTYDKVAVFWSAQGAQLRYAGTGASKEWEDVHITGDPSELKFVAYYYKGDEVVAVASMANDPIVAHSSELLKLGKMPSVTELKGGKSPLDVPLA